MKIIICEINMQEKNYTIYQLIDSLSGKLLCKAMVKKFLFYFSVMSNFIRMKKTLNRLNHQLFASYTQAFYHMAYMYRLEHHIELVMRSHDDLK